MRKGTYTVLVSPGWPASPWRRARLPSRSTRASAEASTSPSPAPRRRSTPTSGGQLTWTDGTHTCPHPDRHPPGGPRGAGSVSGSGGSVSYNVTFGYTGAVHGDCSRPRPAAITAGTVADDPTDSTCSLTSPNAQLIPVTVPAGTTYARFSLFDADVNPGSDIDLCVFRGTTLVGSSGSGTSAEEVNLVNPAAGDLHRRRPGLGRRTARSPFKLHTWLLDSARRRQHDGHRPATATLGGTGAINLTFSGLTAGTKYLGSRRLQRRGRDAEPDDRPGRSVTLPRRRPPPAPRSAGPRRCRGPCPFPPGSRPPSARPHGCGTIDSGRRAAPRRAHRRHRALLRPDRHDRGPERAPRDPRGRARHLRGPRPGRPGRAAHAGGHPSRPTPPARSPAIPTTCAPTTCCTSRSPPFPAR